MKRYKHFLRWVELLALFSAVFLADVILHKLENVHAGSLTFLLVLGIITILVFHVVEYLATAAFERFDWLRRFILGADCIEGVWFDVVCGENLFGIITIDQKAGEVAVVGEQFDTAGRVTATWEDFITSIEGNTLRAVYRAPQFGAQPSELLGFSSYVFSGTPGKPPQYYNGYFADISTGPRKCHLRGFRITDPATLQRLREPHNKTEALLKLIREHQGALSPA